MDKKDIKTIFLDYDGTLHDSLHVYAPAFRKAYRHLVEHHGLKEKKWRDEEFGRFLGMTPKEMWDIFGADLPEQVKAEASAILGEEMRRLVEDGHARLYEGALATLADLRKKGYKLVFISNCKDYYMRAHAKVFGLGEYFDRMVCSDTFEGIEAKHLVLERVKADFPEKMAIVGDRHHDMEAGRFNGLLTIAARYGFGGKEELQDADIHIEDVTELQELF